MNNVEPPIPECRFAVGEMFHANLAFDAESIRRFALMAGDENPLHHDEDVARRSRFGGLIASATHYSSLMMGTVANYLTTRGPAVALGSAFQFRKAVRAGSIMELTWRIVAIEPKASLKGHIVQLEGELRGPDGSLAVSATTTGLVMPDEAIRPGTSTAAA